MDKSPWIKNSSSMTVVYSIFAAIAGALFVFVLQDQELHESVKWPIPLFAFSFFLFSLTAERVAEAVPEKNTQKRIAYMLLYNIGVIVLFIGGALATADISSPKISMLLSYIPLQPQVQSQVACLLIPITIVIYIKWWQRFWACLVIALLVFLVSILYQKHAWWLPAALLSIPWVVDVIWLICSGNKEFQEYFRIEGNIKPASDCRLWEYIFYGIRSSLHRGKSFPHDGIYTRLQCSSIYGVGVFAIRDIPSPSFLLTRTSIR